MPNAEEIRSWIPWRRLPHLAPRARLRPRDWKHACMAPLGNDRWRAAFTCAEFADYEFTVEGWIDRVETLQQGIAKKAAAGQDVSVDREEAQLLSSVEDRRQAARYGR